jgi:hypothetical protein
VNNIDTLYDSVIVIVHAFELLLYLQIASTLPAQQFNFCILYSIEREDMEEVYRVAGHNMKDVLHT